MINYAEQITPNFNLKEFWESATANKNKINNIPTLIIINRIKELTKILQDIREIIQTPITITSGYRTPLLNKMVGGSPKSSHLSGYAVDMQVKGIKPKELRDIILKYLEDKKLSFDELIVEKKGKTSWLHFAYKSINNTQRRKILDL